MATRGASRTPPLTVGCVTDVSAATHPRRRFSPCGEREGEDTLPYNEAPTSFSLHRAKSPRNFVTFAHAHRRFQRVFEGANLCRVYKNARTQDTRKPM